ncbi:MAG: hypothetical protein ACFHU9_00745 [Fluviicola sp.]
MGLQNSYRTLFDIRLLHRFFLDEDNDDYVESGGGDKQPRFDNNRKKYDLSTFFRIVPTERTEKLLQNYKGVFQQYKDGVRVALKQIPGTTPPQPFIAFDSNFYLDFTIEIVDQYFENYTEIDINRDRLVYLSNLNPTTYTPGTANDPPAVTVDANLLSVYDTEVEGTIIDINLLNDIKPDELLNKFGVLRIYLEGEASEIQLVDSMDNTKMNPSVPELNLYLRNRRVKWRFKNQIDQSVVYVTSNRRPLTQNGYMRMPPPAENSPERYPNPDGKFLFWDTDDTEYYAEVFV